MTITMEKKEVIWKLVDQYNRVVLVGPGRKLIVGRGDCDVPLKSTSVDTKHALVEFHPDRHCPTVQDLATENGTFVNDQKVKIDETVFLAHGDRLRFAYDNAVYNVHKCDTANGANSSLPPDQCRFRPLGTDVEQLRLQEVRRNSSATFLSNGASPVPAPSPCRRRSVQGVPVKGRVKTGSDDEVFPEPAESAKVMDSPGPVAPAITDESLSAFVEPAIFAVGSSSEEQSASPEETQPVRDVPPSSPPAAPPALPRAPLSFTVTLEPSDCDDAVEEVVVPVEDKKENLSSYMPRQIFRTMQEREAKKQAAREKREQERKEQEAREKKARLEQEAREKKARLEQEAREKKARLEREAKEKEAAKEKREVRARSSSLVRVGRGTAPPINDARRRNATSGAGGGDTAASLRSSSAAPRPGRTSTLSTPARRSNSKQRAPSSERSAVLKTKPTARRAPSIEKRRTSSGSRGEPNSPQGLADGKRYLISKMLSRKQTSLDADLPARRNDEVDGEANRSEPGSPPSEAGTYTIDSDKEKEKSPQLSDNDTSVLLSQTAKSLQVLEQNYKNGKGQLDKKRRDSDTCENSVRSRREESQNLLFNVFAAGNSRHTPSDQSSDAEHSPSVAGSSRQRAGVTAGSGLKERRTAGVRRSNSDTHKAATQGQINPTRSRLTASSASSVSGAASSPRRRSSDNTPTTTPRKTSNPMTASFHKSQNSSLMTSSMTGSAAFNRTEVGRFSLKQQKPESEGLRRRKEYDPRKQAAEARVSRKKEGEAARPGAGAKERPRRTNSADTRPVTEGGRPAVRPVGTKASLSSNTASSAATSTASRSMGVRRHESLNAGSSGKVAPSQRRPNLQPSTDSLLAPPSSAFLNVSDKSGGRSQSVHNGEASCTEVAYDLLLVSSIQSMSFRLRRGFADLLKKLKEREIISRSPTPPGELYVAMPPAHMNSTNMELKDILENLKAMECLYQSLEARLIRDREEEHPLSSRSQTLGGCTEVEYREEMSRICSELKGFRPIDNDAEAEAEPEAEPETEADCPGPVLKPQARRFESSL